MDCVQCMWEGRKVNKATQVVALVDYGDVSIVCDKHHGAFIAALQAHYSDVKIEVYPIDSVEGVKALEKARG